MRIRSFPLALLPLALLLACGPQPQDGPVGTAAEPITVCAAGSTLEGVDVSHYQGAIDWATVAQSGRTFAFLKATEGYSFVDPTFATNWKAMGKAGLLGGAYHFYHADLDPIMQADHFLATIGTVSGNVLPVLDLETANGQSEGAIAAGAAKWLAHVAGKTGMTPLLYVSPGFLADYSVFNPDKLWVANWGVNCPDVPSPWATWTVWQYSATGTVPGISGSGAVDLDKFNGTLAQFQALTGAMGGTSASSSGAGGGSTSSSSAASTTASGSSTSAAAGAGVTTSAATGSGAATGAGAGAGGSGGGLGVPACAPAADTDSCAYAPGVGGGAGNGVFLLACALLAGSRRRRAPR